MGGVLLSGGAGRVIYDSADAGLSFPVASFDSGTFTGRMNHLRVLASGRTDDVNVAINCKMPLNGDTTAGNYTRMVLFGQNGAASASAASALFCGDCAGAGSTAGIFSHFEALIFDYRNSSRRPILRWHHADLRTDAFKAIYEGANQYDVSGAITRVQFTPDLGSFVSGSRFVVLEF